MTKLEELISRYQEVFPDDQFNPMDKRIGAPGHIQFRMFAISRPNANEYEGWADISSLRNVLDSQKLMPVSGILGLMKAEAWDLAEEELKRQALVLDGMRFLAGRIKQQKQ